MALIRNNSAYQNVTLRNRGEDVMETSVFLHLVLTSEPITSGIYSTSPVTSCEWRSLRGLCDNDCPKSYQSVITLDVLNVQGTFRSNVSNMGTLAKCSFV